MKSKGEALLKKSYHIPLSVFDKAFRSFQKKYVFPRNIVLTVILSAIFIVYFVSMLKEPQNKLVYLLLVICVAMILIIWYNPLKLRRSVMESLKEIENDAYCFTLYADGVEIGTEEVPEAEVEPDEKQDAEPEQDAEESECSADAEASDQPVPVTEIPFGEGLKIHEYDEFFILYLVKKNFYVVPKKDFSESELKLLRDTFPIE